MKTPWRRYNSTGVTYLYMRICLVPNGQGAHWPSQLLRTAFFSSSSAQSNESGSEQLLLLHHQKRTPMDNSEEAFKQSLTASAADIQRFIVPV